MLFVALHRRQEEAARGPPGCFTSAHAECSEGKTVAYADDPLGYVRNMSVTEVCRYAILRPSDIVSFTLSAAATPIKLIPSPHCRIYLCIAQAHATASRLHTLFSGSGFCSSKTLRKFFKRQDWLSRRVRYSSSNLRSIFHIVSVACGVCQALATASRLNTLYWFTE